VRDWGTGGDVLVGVSGGEGKRIGGRRGGSVRGRLWWDWIGKVRGGLSWAERTKERR